MLVAIKVFIEYLMGWILGRFSVQVNAASSMVLVLLTSDTIKIVLGGWGIILFFITCYLFLTFI